MKPVASMRKPRKETTAALMKETKQPSRNTFRAPAFVKGILTNRPPSGLKHNKQDVINCIYLTVYLQHYYHTAGFTCNNSLLE
jgi:hypothetical protein